MFVFSGMISHFLPKADQNIEQFPLWVPQHFWFWFLQNNARGSGQRNKMAPEKDCYTKL